MQRYKPLFILVTVVIIIIITAFMQWPYFGWLGGIISFIIGVSILFLLAIKGVI